MRRVREWLRSATPADVLSTFAWLVTIAFTAAVVALTWKTNCFFGDDFGTFSMSYDKPWLEALFSPLGHQIVPLHRAVTLLLYAWFPMSWTAVIVVLSAFHVLGIAYLYRTLQLLAPSGMSAVLTALYAANVLAGLQLTWMSSGMTRVPYIAFSLIAIYHYLRFCQSAERRHLAILVVAYVLALGFYSKAIFIPIYCVAVDVAWRGMAVLRKWREERAKWVVLILLVEFIPVYALGARSFLDDTGRALNLDVSMLLKFHYLGFTFLGNSLAGNVLSLQRWEPSPLVPVLWLAFFVYSVVRSRSTLRIWALCALLIALNVTLVAVSNRGILFGGLAAIEQRHYFELTFLLAIFLGLLFQELKATVPEIRALTQGAKSKVVALVAALALGAYALTTYSRFADMARTQPSPMTCSYLRQLTADLERLKKTEPAPTFRDGALPWHVVGMNFTFLRHSQLFRLLRAPEEFRPDGRFVVREDGSIAPAGGGSSQ